ncbi:PDDEXK nuclease domain-containing protein [Paradesertivirga mongoliensis]|uniref:PDDEXK nuclease domain-containing protein n=1 Tax=Paradesertivirga mongoliensis TaxID=2100740 RepID=A0ABW4ZKF6_9SPHI
MASSQSDLAQKALRDPYNFDFLTFTDTFNERELEAGLVGHIEKFLLELGSGFAFVGRQYPDAIDMLVIQYSPKYCLASSSSEIL